MDKHYYKKYQTLEREHWWFTARAKILMTHIDRIFGHQKDLNILNIGAATGYSSELLQQFGEVTSIEFDEDCCIFTRDVLKISILQGSILALDFPDNTFDLVCAFDVIEHVEDDCLAVSEMRRVAKQGGVMCVTVPAFMFLWSEHDVVNHHFRRYTSKILRGLFVKGNTPIFHSYFNFWLFFPIAAVRLGLRLFTKKHLVKPEQAQSDFDNFQSHSIINTVLKYIFLSENLFLKQLIPLPIGVSILSSWRKT
ncbi:MAG: class I SAM-dependent methyltransferase [Saprospiraceae bacterium]|nr:class I SAM-dependent methyltransferase [Saprospiraceae bacterium]